MVSPHHILKKTILFLVAGVLILACESMTVEPSLSPNESDEVFSPDLNNKNEDEHSTQIEMIVSETNITDEGAGGVVMVIQNGKILYTQGYGLADVENSIPITSDTVFHVGSVGKQFTAFGVMILAQQEKLDYDDPIGTYFPELEWMGEGVTIRRLLHHTSGIPDYDELEDLYEALMSISEQPSNVDVIAVLSEETELLYEPGSEFLYSNTGYDVLGALIEEVSGQSYPDFMEEYIFSKLGMNETFSVPNSERLDAPIVSQSYMEDGGELYAYEPDPLDHLNGSGSTYSNAKDFFYYDQALYNDTLLPQHALAEAFVSATLNDGKNTGYGFGWDVNKYNNETYYAHAGAWLGFESYYVRFPDQQLSIVLLFNFDYLEPEGEILAFKIADLYLE